MNLRNYIAAERKVRASQKRKGFTLVETLIAVALGTMVLAGVGTLWIFSNRSFVALGNYTDLDTRSRYAVDCMLRDIRQATAVTAFQNNGTNNWLTVTNTQSSPGWGITYSWDSTSRNLVCQKSGDNSRTYLTECDVWDFQLYQRTPHTSGTYVFYPATNSAGTVDLTICKLINMSWRCSRTILGSKVNTENVQTAQVVLRNKQ